MNEKLIIKQFLDEMTRNRVVFTEEEIPGINYTNVGKEVALWLEKQEQKTKHLDNDFVDKVFQSRNKDVEIGEYTALKNIGILFEPELRFDLQYIIDSNSKNQCLIITSKGEISNGYFYFLKKGSAYNINLEGLSYKTIK